MASPTPNKGYTYPSHGGAVGSWDSPLNQNFDYIDLNVAGALPITVTATAATVTYFSCGVVASATADTVTPPSSLAENLYYNITGTLAKNLSVTMPSVGGLYIFGNNSSGAFTVTVVTTGSTGNTVDLVQGGRSILVSDSTGIYQAQSAFGDISAEDIICKSVTASSNITLSGILTQNSCGYFAAPAGTTAQRPSSATAGFYRFNTDYSQPEVADGNNWRQVPVGQPIAAGYRHMKITNATAPDPNANVDFSADAVTVESTFGTAYRLTNISTTICSSFNGAGGLDAGGLANNTFYAVYIIYSASSNTTAGLLSAQFDSSSVTMPAGYTAQARFGAVITTGSAHFKRTLQYGNVVQYSVATGSTTSFVPLIANGVQGTWSQSGAVVWASATVVGNFVPATASQIILTTDRLYKAGGSGSFYVSPSTAYNSEGDSNGNFPPIYSDNGTSGFPCRLTLESCKIYYAANAAGFAVACLGWIDNL